MSGPCRPPHIPLPCLLCVNRDESGATVLSGSWLQVGSVHRENKRRRRPSRRGRERVSFRSSLGCVYQKPAPLQPSGPSFISPPSEPFTPWRGRPPWSSACIFPQASCSCQMLPPSYHAFSKEARVPALALPGLPLSAVATVCLFTCSSPSHPSLPPFFFVVKSILPVTKSLY